MEQATVNWNWYDSHITLQDTLDSLINNNYKIVSIIPTNIYTKKDTTQGIVVQAIIVVSQ